MKPLSPLALCGADDVGGAEGVEAVDEGDADVDFGGLSVRVSGGDAVSEGFAIEPGQAVKVTAVRTNRIFVQPYDPADDLPTKFENNDLLGKSLSELGIDPLDSNRN